ncbi:hypothetical protein ABDI16_15290, partial [Cytobacillus firmus]|uniref:hypothetical protein n=1 Tax=Cytobacillus firmus TaxID=1399 RepID=UPI003D23A233
RTFDTTCYELVCVTFFKVLACTLSNSIYSTKAFKRFNLKEALGIHLTAGSLLTYEKPMEPAARQSLTQ